jgi:hypothetical protein
MRTRKIEVARLDGASLYFGLEFKKYPIVSVSAGKQRWVIYQIDGHMVLISGDVPIIPKKKKKSRGGK